MCNSNILNCDCLLCVGVCCLAGYNHLDVVEYLLEHGADVNAKDKGGLIPLHNASSFGVSSEAYFYVHLLRDGVMCNVLHCMSL